MTTALTVTATLLALWNTPTEEQQIQGDASFYAEGLMRQVCETRGFSLDGYAGAVALMRRGDLGRTVWIFGEPMLVCDCSQKKHLALNLDRDRVAELDWETWERHNLPMGLVPITVSFVPPMTRRMEPL